MNKKASLIPVGVIMIIGAAFATTVIFPNNTEFPTVPTQPGTIGGALTLFNPDGSAKDSDKLDGKSASGYLQNRDCSSEPVNKVWVGVDADGKGICGTRAPMLASIDIGKFSEVIGNVEVMKNGTTTWTPADTSYTLRSGDIIRTNAGTGTVTFTDDLSILRLDVATVVELSTGQNTNRDSVAQAILNDGSLWGRILTSTGVNLGGGGMVAGVRGTSVSVVENSGNYTLAVVDSTLNGANGDNAATVKNTNNANDTKTLNPGQSIVKAATNPDLPAPTISTTTTLLSNSSWNRDNTRKDIEYLYDKKVALPSGEKKTKAKNEYDITLPPTIDITELTALCSGGTSKVFWSSLIDTTFDRCQASGVVAFADYTQPSTPSLPSSFYTNTTTVPTSSRVGTPNTLGYEIKTLGDHIEYPTAGSPSLPSLAGKRIVIELYSSNPIGSKLASGWTKAFIADFGDEKWLVTNGSTCTGTPSASNPNGNFLCKVVFNADGTTSTTKNGERPTGTSITIPMNNPTQFVIGAQKDIVNTNDYSRPIGTIIKKIIIQ